MGLPEEFDALVDAMLFHVDNAERGYQLSPVWDDVLKPRIREELNRCRKSYEWCDTNGDVVAATHNIVSLARDYACVRDELGFDIGHGGSEPHWRVIGSFFMQRWAILGQRRHEPFNLPSYLLRLISDKADTETWEYLVIPAEDGAAPIAHHVVLTKREWGWQGRTTPTLRADTAAMLQLEYGLAVLRPHGSRTLAD